MSGTSNALMSQFMAIKNQNKDAVILFHAGIFYQMYYNDAKVASEVLGLKMIYRGAGGIRIPMCGIPVKSAEKHVETLASKGCRVILCEQVAGETDENGITLRRISRVVEARGEPIDLTEDWDQYLDSYVPEPSGGEKKTKTGKSGRKSSEGCACKEHFRGEGTEADELLEELRQLPLEQLPPMLALNLLYQWKRKYCQQDDGL